MPRLPTPGGLSPPTGEGALRLIESWALGEILPLYAGTAQIYGIARTTRFRPGRESAEVAGREHPARAAARGAGATAFHGGVPA